MSQNQSIVFLTEMPKNIMIKKYVSIKDGIQLYGIGEKLFRQTAEEAKAIYRVGSRVLINVELFEKYLETFRMM